MMGARTSEHKTAGQRLDPPPHTDEPCTMEVYLRYALTSEEVGVEVGEFETIGQLRENAAEEFDCDVEHVELQMDGVSIGDDEELVSAATSLTHASVVDVVVSTDVFVEHIRNGTRRYTDLPDSVQRDIPCALAALQSNLNRTGFRDLPPEVQTHPTIVERLASSPKIFETAHPSAWHDEDFRSAVLTATNGICLSWDCCEDLRSDRDTVFACVQRNGDMLKYASSELKKCPVIVLASVQRCPSAIQYAAEEVRADHEVFTAAVVGGAWEPTWLPEALRADRGLAMRCVRRCSSALRAFSDEVKGDQFVVAAAGSLVFASEDLKKDKEFVIWCVGKHYADLEHVNESLQSDRDVVMAAIAHNKGAFCFACNSIRDDPELALQCSTACPDVAQHYGETLCQDKGFILSAIRENAEVFRYLKDQWHDDEDAAKLAVEGSVDNFCQCSDTLRDNHAFVLFAVQKGANLHDASAALRSDTELCRAAAALAAAAAEAAHHSDLRSAPPALRDDFEFVKKAVSTKGTDLHYASPALQDTYDIVLAAVQHSCEGFLFASPRLRKCETLAREALGHRRWRDRDGCYSYASGFRFLGTYLLDDKAFILSISTPGVISYVSKRLQADRDVVLSCVHQDGSYLECASSDLRDDRGVVEAAVTSGDALKFASPRLQRDHSLVLLAVTHCGRSLQYACSDLQNNIDIVRAAVAQKWESLKYANRTLLRTTDIVHSVLPEHPRALQYASAEVRNDVSIVAPLAKKDVRCLAYAGPAVLSDRAFILSAVQQNPDALQHASQELRDDPDIAAALIEHPAGDQVPPLSLELLGNKDFMMKAITKHPSWFLNASVRLQNDPVFVLLVVRKEEPVAHIIRHAGAGVRADYNTMLEVVTKCSGSLEHASRALRNNLDIVTAAVLKDPHNFEHASAALRNCKRVAMLAMRGCAENLRHASETLQNDPEVVLCCITQDEDTIQYAGPVKDRYRFAVKAVRKRWSVFEHLSSTLQTNPNFILACINDENEHRWDHFLCHCVTIPSAWAHTALMMRLLPVLGGETVMTQADEKVRRKFKVALACVDNNTSILELVPLQLRENKDFIMACLDLERADCINFFLIGDRLWCDADVVTKAIATAPTALRRSIVDLVPPQMRENKDFIMSCLDLEGADCINFFLIGDRLWCDADVVMKAIATAPATLRNNIVEIHKRKTLFANRAFMLECVRRDGSNLQYASEALQDDVHVVLEALRSKVSAAAFARPSVLRHPRVRVLLWGHKAVLAGWLPFVLCNRFTKPLTQVEDLYGPLGM